MHAADYAAEGHGETYHEDEGIGSCHQGHELCIGVLVVQHLQLLLPCLGCSLPSHCIVPHLRTDGVLSGPVTRLLSLQLDVFWCLGSHCSSSFCEWHTSLGICSIIASFVVYVRNNVEALCLNVGYCLEYIHCNYMCRGHTRQKCHQAWVTSLQATTPV